MASDSDYGPASTTALPMEYSDSCSTESKCCSGDSDELSEAVSAPGKGPAVVPEEPSVLVYVVTRFPENQNALLPLSLQKRLGKFMCSHTQELMLVMLRLFVHLYSILYSLFFSCYNFSDIIANRNDITHCELLVYLKRALRLQVWVTHRPSIAA